MKLKSKCIREFYSGLDGLTIGLNKIVARESLIVVRRGRATVNQQRTTEAYSCEPSKYSQRSYARNSSSETSSARACI